MRAVPQIKRTIRPCQSNSEGCLPEDEIDRRANAFNAINLHTVREELVSWGRGYR